MKNSKRNSLLILAILVAQGSILTSCEQNGNSSNLQAVSLPKGFRVIGYLYGKHTNIEKLKIKPEYKSSLDR